MGSFSPERLNWRPRKWSARVEETSGTEALFSGRDKLSLRALMMAETIGFAEGGILLLELRGREGGKKEIEGSDYYYWMMTE